MKPITPHEVAKRKTETLPDGVIEAFNELIVRNWTGRQAVVLQSQAADLIATKMDVSRAEVFEHHWLDVEGVFQKAGWDVDYDNPGYCESYEANFTFRLKK